MSGTIKRRMIKAAPLASSNDPSVFPMKERFRWGYYNSRLTLNNPGNWARARRRAAPGRKIAFRFWRSLNLHIGLKRAQPGALCFPLCSKTWCSRLIAPIGRNGKELPQGRVGSEH